MDGQQETSNRLDEASPIIPPQPLPSSSPQLLNTVLPGIQNLNLGTPQVDPAMVAAILAALQLQGNQSQKATKMKIKEPDSYDGRNRGGEAERFILSCKNYFKARSSEFPNDRAKIQFTLSYLTGTAQAWGDTILRDLLGYNLLGELSSWVMFEQSFIQAFGDPDKEGTAIRKLENLTQGNRPAATYAADFRRLKADIKWNEQAFMHAYRQGLRADVKDGMVYHDKPTTLEKLIALTIRIDDRLWEQKQEKSGDHNPRPQPRPQPQPPRPQVSPAPMAPPSNAPNSFAHSHPVPIHVDAARRGRIAPEEKERRRREGLCYYCGEKGHTAAAHQLRPRQAVIDYSYQVPQNHTSFIAATQTPTPTIPAQRNNTSFTVSVAPQSTNRSDPDDGGFGQGFPLSTQ